MAATVTCKFDEDPIKIEGTIEYCQITAFCHSMASNSKVDSPIWPEFELIQDVMAVLVTCKIDEHPIKSEYHPDNIFSIISLWENFSSLKG